MNSISWEDMVFTNRNQSYGAYLLRKAYPGRVTMSFAFAMTLVTLILASPSIKSMLAGEQGIVQNEEKIKKVITLEDIRPIDPIVIPPQKINPPKVEVTRFVPPKVTDTKVEDTTPTMDELMKTNISDHSSNGEVTLIENPPVVELPADTGVKPEEPYYWVEIAPEFPGGQKKMMEFIRDNIKYPAIARRMEIQGLVYASFIIDKDGTITDISITKGISGDCDNEAMRVIGKMPKWKPGRQGGNPVKVRFVLPIKFTLG